jgi:hypothetical protein
MRILAIVASAAAIVFAVLFFRTISIPSGGGQGEASPDGVFVASASSLRNDSPIAADRRTYYEFTVTRGYTQIVKRVVLYPSEQNDPMYFRALPRIVMWSPDSSNVTFSIPGATLKLDVLNHAETRSP